MNARECVDLALGRWVYVPWGRGRTVAQGSAAAQESPVAQKSHGALRLSVRSPMLCPKHHQREETRARAKLREIAWPFNGRAAVRRPTHQTVIESPSRGR